MKLIAGIHAAQLRLRNNVEAFHKGYDLKVSTEACQEEIAKVCAANLARIQAESVFGIHLTEEEATASLSGKNWELIRKNPIERIISRIFTCPTGNHQLRAEVLTDSNDEKIVGIRLRLFVKGSVRCHDGSERPELFDGNVFIDEEPSPREFASQL